MPTSSLPVPLPIPPTEGFWDSLSVYIAAFGDYLDKQWWGPYAVPAFTVLGAVVVYSAGLKEISKVQEFHTQLDRHYLPKDATGLVRESISTDASTGLAGGGGGDVRRETGPPGSMGSPGSTGGKKRR